MLVYRDALSIISNFSKYGTCSHEIECPYAKLVKNNNKTTLNILRRIAHRLEEPPQLCFDAQISASL